MFPMFHMLTILASQITGVFYFETFQSLRLTNIVFNINLRASFCKSAFTLNILIAFSNVHTKEKRYPSLKFTIYKDAANNTLSYTHVSSYMIGRIHPRGYKFIIVSFHHWLHYVFGYHFSMNWAPCRICCHTWSLVYCSDKCNRWMHLLEPILLSGRIFRSDCGQLHAVGLQINLCEYVS